MNKKVINFAGVTPQTWARTIWLVIALIGQLCVVFHFAPLPEAISSLTVEQITVYLTTIFGILGEIRAWWKNNSFSVSAQEGDAVMHAHEDGELEYTEKLVSDTDHEHHEVG